ncbi:MAG: RpoL/Rpb11 RNA polymerase subunit family protein [Candidatus Micrarchaeia archaeon]
MKLNLLEDEPKSVIIEFDGSDRAIAELIKEKLQNNKGVEFASVSKAHFETGKPRLIVKSDKNAKKLILDAVEEIKEDLKSLKSQLPKK